MSGHIIHQIVKVSVAAPKNAPTVESVFGDRFRVSTIEYNAQASTANKAGFFETVTLFSSAGDGFDNVTFFTDCDDVPAWVPEPPEEYKRLLATLKEVAA